MSLPAMTHAVTFKMDEWSTTSGRLLASFVAY